MWQLISKMTFPRCLFGHVALFCLQFWWSNEFYEIFKTPSTHYIQLLANSFNSPGMQMQRNPPRSSMHVPSFWQGFDSHSLMFISQRRPLNPGRQSHRYEPGMLTQVPPCSQGEPKREKNYHEQVHFLIGLVDKFFRTKKGQRWSQPKLILLG